MIKSSTLIALLTVYFATVLDVAFWRYVYHTIAVDSFRSACFVVSLGFFVIVPLFLIFNLIVVKKIGKPLIIFLWILCSFTNFMMVHYGVYINRNMIRNVMETNVKEATDLMTWSLWVGVFFTGILPSVLLIITKIQYRPFREELKKRLTLCIMAVVILGGSMICLFRDYAAFRRNHREARDVMNIVNFVAGSVSYVQKVKLVKKELVILDAHPVYVDYKKKKSAPVVVIFVLGETARAANFSLNGYARRTNPLLEGQDIAYFKDVKSCGTDTAVSVPCLFSHMKRKKFDLSKARYTEHLLDLVQKAGYQVIWRENDGGCKGVWLRTKNRKTMVKVNNPKYCHNDSCWDESLLEDLDEILANVTQNTFIVLHTQGSHGPAYYERYPDKFKQYKIAPEEQTSVPMLVWLNDTMKKGDYIDYKCLKEAAQQNAYAHDHIFHSLLGLLKVKTSVYDGNYDLFKPCRTKELPAE